MPSCNNCEVELTEDNWYPSLKKSFSYICKECCKKKQRENRAKNVEHYRAKDRERNKLEHVKKYNREQARKYYHKHPEVGLWSRAKSRAKKKKLDFNIEVSDIKIPEKCPILGIPMYISKGCSSDNSISLDRIDPSKGYTKDNIQVISFRANSIKQDATIEELERLLNYLKDLKRDTH